ncbi:MAG: formate--tetrahydrofolate ligase, partial [Oscillospiraceae bacterium]|nr:formate--tetrahydrofolate ligase [Oscillospiraceae bacterium]
KNGADFALSEVFAKGGDGGIELAEKVVAACEKPSDFRVLYPDEMPIKEKIETVAKKIYGADGVNFEPNALKALAAIEALDESYKLCPVCMAKTQYSLSDDQTKLGRPEGFRITVRDIKLSAGAGFVVVLTGAIMTMPGLPKAPAANVIDVDEDGKIVGLF